MWERKCLHDKVKWGEWGRHHIVALGYHQLSDTSEGRSFASGPQLSQVVETMKSTTMDRGVKGTTVLWEIFFNGT